MKRITTDVCVIGAGSGGLSLAAGAVQMGARVVLIEGGEMGGDCLNHGCVPSKALLAAGAAAEARRRGGMGLLPELPLVDFAAAKDHVASVIAAIAPHDSQERFEGLGVTVIRAMARFTGPREVEAGGNLIRARRFVIATGARPVLPSIDGIETVPVLTNETIFALRQPPAHLLILGGGPIGMEMAQAHRRLGCDVTLVEAAQLLAREDPEAAAVVTAALQAEGVALRQGQVVVRLRPVPDGVEAVLADGEVIRAGHVLAATGRKPVLEGLGLDAAGVAYTAQGVSVGAGLRSTTNRRVYALGDAAGGAQFTHLAGAHAGVVIRQILLGLPAKAPQKVPRVTYTDPELAQAGLTEAEARSAHGAALTVLRQPFADNDRARTEGRTAGFLKLMVVRGRPVGATLVGPGAGEAIAFWQLALIARIRLSAIAGMILPYPTRAEIAKRASGAYFSARVFDNPALKRVVRLVQRLLP